MRTPVTETPIFRAVFFFECQPPVFSPCLIPTLKLEYEELHENKTGLSLPLVSFTSRNHF